MRPSDGAVFSIVAPRLGSATNDLWQYRLDADGPRPDRTGFLVSTDQIPGGSVFKLYRREGEPGAPHKHQVLQEIRTSADETDGIEVSTAPLPGFPQGLLVAMNSGPRNFAVLDWARITPR